MVAAAVGIGTAVAGTAGAAMSSSAAKSAANTQADAANRAADLQWQQFQQMQQNLQPYMDLGSNSISGLQALLNGGGLTQQFNFNPSQKQLEQTPGYQFTLQQGLKGVDNAAAAKGLNLSGAQLKGISDYTTGLADQTYQQQYQNALQSFMTNYGINSDQYNRLAGLVGLGQNAAAGVGNAGLQTASNVGNALMGGAAARAAGQVGSANAINGGIGSLGSSVGLYSLLNNQNAMANSGFGYSGPGSLFGGSAAAYNMDPSYGG
ncbi:DNA transfer protein p32 [Cupriavidus basilensis]|uniref:DNA transfer protein p32 n=1 Tax=Cupriavidus basilensis TaxID=68895 RepID=UPI000A41A434|nr:DNA transfer protein p32 [Cupriavidus basilensis]